MTMPTGPTDAVQFFLDRFGLNATTLESVVGSAIARRADYADLYFEFRTVQSLSLEDGIVKTAGQDVSQGVGVRVVAGDKTGYAHSDDVTVDSLRLATRTAQAIAHESGETRAVAVHQERPRHDLYALRQSPLETPVTDKVDLLNRIDIAARRFDPRIKNVLASIGVEQKLVLIVSSTGLVVGDVQPLVRLNVTCIAEEGGARQQGSYGGGGRVEYAYVLEDDRFLRYTRTAAEQAVRNLHAVDAPAGAMTVVLGPGWPGVLLHEAIGHGLEGDFNRKKTSAFAELMGQAVASPLCTVVDDGTMANRRGSLNVDDEGTPTGRTVLIEKGILARLPAGSAERAADGHGADRQRPARELRAHPDAAHDQHVHAGRRDATGGDHPLGGPRPLRRLLRRRAGGHHERQVRVLRHRGVPHRGWTADASGEGRDPHRQRPRRAQAHQHGGHRPATRRRHRHVRQGRAIGAGRGRAADGPHRRPDRRRDRREVNGEAMPVMRRRGAPPSPEWERAGVRAIR